MDYVFFIIILVLYFCVITVRVIRTINNNSVKKDKTSRIDNTNGAYVDSDRYLNVEDNDLKQDHSNASRLIQKCDVCGKKSELSFSYCPYCGAFLLGDIVNETEK